MNFLERLVAELYEQRGYLVRTNVRFGNTPTKGGYHGEIDVLGVKFDENRIVHIETSSSADTLEKQLKPLRVRFEAAPDHYRSLLSIPQDFAIESVDRLFIFAGSASPRTKTRSLINEFKTNVGVKVWPMSRLMKEVVEHVRTRPKGTVIPESSGYLRAIQFAMPYSGASSPLSTGEDLT